MSKSNKIALTNQQHNIEIQKNLKYWNKKPILKKIYNNFYNLIKQYINFDTKGNIIEIGSGIGNLRSVIPNCICTDMFSNSWIDKTENAYKLSFKDKSVSNIILFDVWHHLQYPGTVLKELNRVLNKNGRIIIFDPDISLLGHLIYGLFHHEPIAYKQNIEWFAPQDFNIHETKYYAAQGNAHRIFCTSKFKHLLKEWKIISQKRYSAISYVTSGGYRSKQLYPDSIYPIMKQIDKFCNFFPFLFSTRLLIVLEKE